MATITVKRTGKIVTHNGKKGEISEIDVDGLKLYAVERRDGFMSLDDGTYTVKMEISPTYKRRQFRVLNHKKKTLKGEPAAILIHAGNYPGDVEGCIAPGTVTKAGGVDHSNMAMEQIFQKFGGFQNGQEGTLVITTTQGG